MSFVLKEEVVCCSCLTALFFFLRLMVQLNFIIGIFDLQCAFQLCKCCQRLARLDNSANKTGRSCQRLARREKLKSALFTPLRRYRREPPATQGCVGRQSVMRIVCGASVGFAFAVESVGIATIAGRQ